MSDLFDDVFTLEERYYREGYAQGQQDGVKAGMVEGRSFGMQKGFDKFLESGRLASKAVVWANRMPGETNNQARACDLHGSVSPGVGIDRNPASNKGCTLPPLPQSARLQKNVQSLYALVEPDTLSTANTDEAVQDFDDRLKRAQGKAKVIERMVPGGRGAKDGSSA